MRWHTSAAALLLAFAATAAAQVRISGVVTAQDGSASPVPVPRAYVLARAGETPRVIAEAETDSRGRYALTGLPGGRITLAVQAQGYYTLRAGGVGSDSIARSCPQEGDCGETKFDLARAAVVEGWLTDSYGDPYQDVMLELRPESTASASPDSRMQRSAGRAMSDDRGYFRMWDLRPGRYELALQQRGMGGPPVEVHKQSIEIAPGQPVQAVRIALNPDLEVFSISGEVVGLEADETGRRAITVQESGDGFSNSMRFGMLHGGKFAVQGLHKGRYILKLAEESGDGRKWAYLETLDVDRDLMDLKLSPKPPTGVRGQVEFVEGEPSDLHFAIGPPGNNGYSHDWLAAGSPEHTFAHEGLAPGEYEVVLRNRAFYLVDRVLVTVQLGQMAELTLRVSNLRSSVRGTAHVADGDGRQTAAHFTVILRSDRERYKFQTDDAGGFSFEDVIPGDYEIAAFESANVDEHDEEAWRRAGENRKRLALEAGFETDIELTVTR